MGVPDIHDSDVREYERPMREERERRAEEFEEGLRVEAYVEEKMEGRHGASPHIKRRKER